MTNATPNSLMRRTKAELVNIILRKDETEAKASEEIKSLEKKLSVCESDKEKTIENCNTKVQSIKDYYNKTIYVLKADNKRLKNNFFYLIVLYIALIIIMLL